MAPTVAICRSASLGSQPRETAVYSKRNVASGIWVCQPSAMPPLSNVLCRSASFKKGGFYVPSPALDVTPDGSPALEEVTEVVGVVDEEGACECAALPICETPKAKKYRIPVVDVEMCPPAPKKARPTHSRLPVACSSERERSSFLQKLSFSRSYLC